MVVFTNTITALALVIVLWSCSVDCIGRGSISISDNGYSNILISISERVEEDKQLIQRIKTAFTDASAFLYEATRKRAYFQNITILLPNSWPSDPSYEPVRHETPDKSDILIDLPDEGQGERPFTVKITPCGEPGYYTRLTPGFLLHEEIASGFGEYGRVLIHEWAHLRFGVFDEYPSENGGQHFYAERDGYIEGTRCSTTLSGTMRTTDDRVCRIVDGLPESDCRFIDDEDLSNRYASIMYRSHLKHIFHFCDNDPSNELSRHNSRAPTHQNQMCEGRSVWEVLRQHQDFFNGTNPPREVSSTIPNFRVVHQSQKQTVLVLDISTSMRGERLDKLNQGCSTFISTILRDGEALGIVSFGSFATKLRDLTIVNNDTRQYLLDGLPTTVSGSTSIGSGVRLALEVLQQGDDETGTLIIVSDGQENRSPLIRDVWEEVMSSGVTVHTIAITDQADSNLEALALATRGLSFIYSERDNSNAINEAFRAIGELNSDPTERSYPLLSKTIDIARLDTVTERVIIDDSLGRDTQFFFDYSQTQGLLLNILSPSGTYYDTNSPECDQDTTYRVYRFTFPGNSATGEWTFNITNLNAAIQSVSVTVVSKSSSSGEYPITAQAFWGHRDMHLIVPGREPDIQALYASVAKGYMPVLRANVTATVERPNSGTVDVILRDNGSGADLTADDGIYSAYFIQFTDDGRYGVTVSVNDNPTTVISPIRIIGQGAASGWQRSDAPSDLPTGQFQRLANGGSFELSEFTTDVKYPPGRIHDFQLTEVDRFTNQVTLEWTSVGAQLEFETLSRYDIRFSQDFDELWDHFDDQVAVTNDTLVSGSDINNPQPPGEVESITLLLPTSSSFTYYFAIKGVDNNGRNASGPMSNIVSATLRDITPPDDPDLGPDLGLILGVTFGALALVAILVTVSIVAVKKARNSKMSSQLQMEGASNPTYFEP